MVRISQDMRHYENNAGKVDDICSCTICNEGCADRLAQQASIGSPNNPGAERQRDFRGDRVGRPRTVLAWHNSCSLVNPMNRFWTRLSLFFIILAMGLVVAVQLLTRDWSGTLMSPTSPDASSVRPSPTSLGADCVRDPVDSPAPLGSEGRPANYLHTCNSRLYDSLGQEASIVGLNWSGMETGDYAPGGLSVRKWQEILDLVAGLGYNTLRLPFSNEALEPDRHVGGINFAINPDLQGLSGLEMLDRIIAGARERGLRVILDRHRPVPWSSPAMWYTGEVREERWIADWRMLAARYYGNDAVIGFDLHNEPRNPATWGSDNFATDWRLAAERAGNAILEVNPFLLIFVEGVEDYNGDHYWWGGNLEGVRTAPVRLAVPNRVVYSPHDYGPNISDQTWFHDADFPQNLPAKWDRSWGYISELGIAPIVLGEFGGSSVGSDREGQWQRTLVDYLREHRIGALIWSLNPSWDTGGILADDWRTVRWEKQQLYQQVLTVPLKTDSGVR